MQQVGLDSRALAGAAFVATALIFVVAKFGVKTKLNDNRSDLVNVPLPDRSAANGTHRRIHILYGTTTGTARTFSQTLSRHIEKKCNLHVSVSDLKDYNEELLSKEDIVLFICSTWTDGKAPQTCQRFFDWVQDQAFDFRVSKDVLSGVEFSIFGLGGELYGGNFCKAVRNNDLTSSVFLMVRFVSIARHVNWMNNYIAWVQLV